MTFNCRSYINAKVQRVYSKTHYVPQCPCRAWQEEVLGNSRQCEWAILPPSTEPGVEIAEHRTVSSSGAPQRT